MARLVSAFVVDPQDRVHFLDARGIAFCGRDFPFRYPTDKEPARAMCEGCSLGFEVAKHLALSASPPGEAAPEDPP